MFSSCVQLSKFCVNFKVVEEAKNVEVTPIAEIRARTHPLIPQEIGIGSHEIIPAFVVESAMLA